MRSRIDARQCPDIARDLRNPPPAERFTKALAAKAVAEQAAAESTLGEHAEHWWVDLPERRGVGNTIACPRHGSKFALAGAVLREPAISPLTEVPVGVEDSPIVADRAAPQTK